MATDKHCYNCAFHSSLGCGKLNLGDSNCKDFRYKDSINKNDQTLMDELRSIADECPSCHLGMCLDQAKQVICGERQDTYGSPEDSFALIAQYWNIYLNEVQKTLLTKNGFDFRDYKLVPMLEAKDVAHMMILFKMARVQGQRPSRDNYVDIAGYVSIAADRLSD